MTETNANQDLFASTLVLTEAELLELQHPINVRGDTRRGGRGLGKRAGMKVLIDMGAQTTVLGGDALKYKMYKEVMALGPKSSDPFVDLSNAATLLVPVNIVDPDQTAVTWTLDDNCTYVAGLMTGTDAEVSQIAQSVTLSAGTYRISGKVNRAVAEKAAKLIVTGATDGIVLTKTFAEALISLADATQEEIKYDVQFTLAAESQVVTFVGNIVTIATGAAVAGAAHLRFILEAV